MLRCDWLVFISFQWHILILSVSVSCSPWWSTVILLSVFLFLDRGHPCFWIFYSIILFDFAGFKFSMSLGWSLRLWVYTNEDLAINELYFIWWHSLCFGKDISQSLRISLDKQTTSQLRKNPALLCLLTLLAIRNLVQIDIYSDFHGHSTDLSHDAIFQRTLYYPVSSNWFLVHRTPNGRTAEQIIW